MRTLELSAVLSYAGLPGGLLLGERAVSLWRLQGFDEGPLQGFWKVLCTQGVQVRMKLVYGFCRST